MVDEKWSDGELFRAIQEGDERTRQGAKDTLVGKYDEKLIIRIVA